MVRIGIDFRLKYAILLEKEFKRKSEEEMAVVLKSVATLFILIFLGFVLGKKKILHPDIAPQLCDFLIKVALPVTVFLSMQMEYDAALVRSGIQIFVIAIVFHLLCMLIGMATAKLLRIPDTEKGIWVFVCMFSNNGFMGFPLALTLYGNDGLFLMSIANVVTNFLIFSVGVHFMLKGYPVKEKISLKKMIVNNINIAVVLGLACYFSQIRLPALVLDTLQYVGNITAGLSMIVVGLSMAKLDIRQMLRGKSAYLLTAMRLVCIPLLTILILKLIPVKMDTMMLSTLMLMSVLPAPSSVTILSEKYHTNTGYGSKIIFLTTVCCLVTIPIFMFLIAG